MIRRKMATESQYSEVPIDESVGSNDDDEDNEGDLEISRPAVNRCHKKTAFYSIVATVLIAITTVSLYIMKTGDQVIEIFKNNNADVPVAFPPKLLGTVYDMSDFRNKDGNVPAYWKNISQYNTSEDDLLTWGPCYPPSKKEKRIRWDEIELGEATKLEYPKSSLERNREGIYGVSNMCKPGFLIIGAGKCGTSSLYHYIVGHPRVLPASEKQVHYFKYYSNRDLAWYYSHFPTTESFLSSGALMTGEAAPGYIPYPYVAYTVRVRMPGPKILTIAREPLDRAWSSYNYNYVRDAVKVIKRKGAIKGYPRGKSDEYYQEHHVFKFEDFIRTELALLKKCMEPGGKAEEEAKKKYYNKFKTEYERRENEGLPPMVDIIDVCYPQPKYKSSPREQWSEMIKANPKREIGTPNLHLVEAFIGRGLYAAQVEWWYAAHPTENNYLVCSEDLKERPAETMLNVSNFLGLPDFDFTDVVGEGMFNVAGHKGYDKATPWDEVEEEKESEQLEIPLSDALRKELLEFLDGQNERLFALAGKRCPW